MSGIDRARVLRLLILATCLLALAGCATKKSYVAGKREFARENYDAAVLHFSKAVAKDPDNARYSTALEQAKVRGSLQHFERGRRFASAAQWELAIAEFQQTLLLNPGHQYAADEMARALTELNRLRMSPSELEVLKEQARRRDLGPKRLDPRSNIPILLNFTDVEIGKIFEAISKASGINFIFDEKVDLDKPMTIDIGNVTLEKALDILMLQTKNFYKVIDEHTLLIAPDTRQKRQEYEDQVIQTFFLSNADTKQVLTLLRSLLQSRQIAENPDLNSVTLKDTPDKVAIAERIIVANDKSKGEVIIDVELLEINNSVTKTLGIDLSSKTLSLTFRDGESAIPLNNLKVLKEAGNWTLGVIPSVVLNFLRSDSNTKVVARPQLRVTEGEQAEILIGDRVPIPTTSFNTSQTIGGNIVPITSFTYQNVGITVQIEPRVHHNKEVTLKVQVEFSQVTDVIDAGGGQSQPVIGTRQIQTVIRLGDGETNMLAGLIQRSRSDGVSSVTGIGDIPGLRRLFGTTSIQDRETDIIMTLTPRIIRVPNITEDDLTMLWVGTEENMQLRGTARNRFQTGPFSPPEAELAAGAEYPTETGNGAPPLVDELPPPRGGSIGRQTRSQAAEEEAAAAAAEQVPDDVEIEAPVDAESPGSGTRRSGTGQAGSVPTADPGRDGFDDGSPEDDAVEPFDVEDGGRQDPRDSNQDSGGAFDDDVFGDDEPEVEPTLPAAVRLVPDRPVYNVGDTAYVQVVLENGTNVGSVPFHLRYNPRVLQFVPPAIEGGFLNADGNQTVFLSSDSSGGGEIVVGLSRLGGGEGVSGTGVLATFQFLAVGEGDCGFAFTGSSVKDPQARNLPAAFAAGSVRVEP